jgi:hypothetical protein
VEKTKLAHPLSHLPKEKNRGEGWWAAVFIGSISRTGPYPKPVLMVPNKPVLELHGLNLALWQLEPVLKNPFSLGS